MTYAVRLRDLTKDFNIGFWRPRPRRALHGVTLDVTAGEVLGYLGPNGAGKTTTLKLLMQLISTRRRAARRSSGAQLATSGCGDASGSCPRRPISTTT